MGITLDTGALIALERRSQRMSLIFATASARGVTITVPAPVIVEWWRGQPGMPRRFVEAMDIEPLSPRLARIAGESLALVGKGPSATDAVVMASAALRGDTVYTSDIDDLKRLQTVFPNVRVFAA